MRDIILTGAANFRDMGGYATRSGRQVRWGRIYRSGELPSLTDEDRATLDTLGIRTLYDLRATGERTRRPTAEWGGPRRVHRDYGHSGADIPSLVRDSETGRDALREMMFTLYRGLPEEQADAFRAMFQLIAVGEVPLLFHCAAGKDRTGAFAALLLDLLGVGRADIYEDYLLTNRGIDRARTRFVRYIRRDDIAPGTWDPLLLVDSDYLDAMFEVIDGKHGGTCAYAVSLGLSDAQIEAIREHLLEPA